MLRFININTHMRNKFLNDKMSLQEQFGPSPTLGKEVSYKFIY